LLQVISTSITPSWFIYFLQIHFPPKLLCFTPAHWLIRHKCHCDPDPRVIRSVVPGHSVPDSLLKFCRILKSDPIHPPLGITRSFQGLDRRHLRLPIGRHGAHLLQIPLACCSTSSRSMRVVQIRSMAGGRAAACPSSSKSWSRRASARYDSQPSWVLKASASALRASRCSRS
jgi:hypothetical protein